MHSYNFGQFAIFAKNCRIWWKFDIVITKIILLAFWDTVYSTSVRCHRCVYQWVQLDVVSGVFRHDCVDDNRVAPASDHLPTGRRWVRHASLTQQHTFLPPPQLSSPPYNVLPFRLQLLSRIHTWLGILSCLCQTVPDTSMPALSSLNRALSNRCSAS